MTTTKRVEIELREQEQTLASALERRDVETLSRLLAADYVFISASGEAWGRDRAVAEFSDPRLNVDHIQVEVETIVALDDAGVVTGRSEVDGHVGDLSLSGAFRFTHVWRRAESCWQLMSGHTSARESGTGSDLEAIRQVARRWITAMNSADLGELERLMCDDIVVVHGDGRMLCGRPGVLADLAASFHTLRVQQRVTPLETVVDRSWAFERADVSTSVGNRGNGEMRRYHSRTLTILRRDPSGQWRIARAMGVVSRQPPARAAEHTPSGT